LPVTLRGDIAEVASGEANSRPAFERVLDGYDIEVDGELKIAASIYYHRYLARTSNGPSAARGGYWGGREVKQCPVVYMAAEGSRS
jgi:hypothetical protein